MNFKDQLAILSEDERKILNKFRDTVQDILQPHHDDYFLLRFLKARTFDIRKAEKMISESLKFRKKINTEDIESGTYVPPEVFRRYKITAPLGFDKEGCVVRYFMGGLCDFKGYVYSLHPIEVTKLVMYIFESDAKDLVENNRKNGSHEARSVYIADFTDFSLRQFYDKYVVQAVSQTFHVYQDNYPETLKVAFFVNVPSYFNWIWNIMKRFLDQVTLSKIKIYTPENLSWKEELMELVDPEIIPAFLGGVRCDPDGNPTCQTLISWNSKIPTSFYLKDKHVLRTDDPEVKAAVILERSHFEHRISIEKPGSIISWEFQTKNYNVRFGIFYEKVECANKPNAPTEELITVKNVECHVIPESGVHTCEKAGQYILHFDNSYSWLTAKHLLYKVTVNEPHETSPEDNQSTAS